MGLDAWGLIHLEIHNLFVRGAEACVDSDVTHNNQALDKKHTVPGVHNPVQVSFAKQPVTLTES